MKTIPCICAAVAFVVSAGTSSAAVSGAINMGELVDTTGKTDVSAAIQRVIDANPNRTLYFPDGTYLLANPICTPAHPEKSVDLQLSNFAVLKASPEWTSNEAMVRLGAIHRANNIRTPGSCYSMTGGIVDGSGKANGVAIESGRETKVRCVSMKNVFVGLHIKYGANNGSSDCDISDVNIVGNRKPGSTGVILEGHDNTLSNMRIADVHIGFNGTEAVNTVLEVRKDGGCGYIRDIRMDERLVNEKNRQYLKYVR